MLILSVLSFLFVLFISIKASLFKKDFMEPSKFMFLPEMKTQWIALSKELNLNTNFKTMNLNLFRLGLKPRISGILNGFQVNIILKRTGPLAKNTIQCSIKVNNHNLQNFIIKPKKNTISKARFITKDEEFDSKVKISSNTQKKLNQVLNSKIRKSILSLFKNKNSPKISLSHQTPDSINEDLILDSSTKSILSYSEKDILILNYSEKNHFKIVVNLLIKIATRIEMQNNK